MLTPDLITVPFAQNGDKTEPPITSPTNFVNMTTGYTPDYEIDLTSGNPSAKAVERQVQNYMFYLLTGNVAQLQQYAYPIWYATMPGGYPYGAMVSVLQSDGVTSYIYRSLQNNNSDQPGQPNVDSWEYIPTNMEALSNVAMPAGGINQPKAGGQTTEVITVATDFNSVTTGTYEVASDAVAASCAHCPSQYAGMLECKQWTSGGNPATPFAVQRYTDRSGAIYWRGQQNNAWTGWSTAQAIGYTPANQAITITGTGMLAGGGDLSANRTINMATSPASTLVGNPTTASAVPQNVTLANGIIFGGAGPYNLGLGNITPVTIATTYGGTGAAATFTGSGSPSNVIITDAGANGANLKLTGNGTTTPSKTIRASNGRFEVVNNAYNTVIQATVDNGDFYTGAFGTAQGSLFTNNAIVKGQVQIGNGLAVSSAAPLDVSTGAGRILFRTINGVSTIDSVIQNNSAYAGLTFTATGFTMQGGQVNITGGVYVSGNSSLASAGNYASATFLADGIAHNAAVLAGMVVQSYVSGSFNGAAGMTFYRPGQFGCFFGLDSDNVLAIGGWSYGGTRYPICHQGLSFFQLNGTFRSGSDSRVKPDATPITGALDIVRKYLVGHTYHRSDLDGNPLQAGLVAQKVKEGLPHLVHIEKRADIGIDDFHFVDYNGAEAYYGNAITEVDDKVIALQKRIDEQGELISSLMKRLEKLEAR